MMTTIKFHLMSIALWLLPTMVFVVPATIMIIGVGDTEGEISFLCFAGITALSLLVARIFLYVDFTASELIFRKMKTPKYRKLYNEWWKDFTGVCLVAPFANSSNGCDSVWSRKELKSRKELNRAVNRNTWRTIRDTAIRGMHH